MAKKREMPELVEEITKETKEVSREAELIDQYIQNKNKDEVQEVENKSARLYGLVKPSVKEKLDRYTKEKRVSKNQIINDLLEEFLNKNA